MVFQQILQVCSVLGLVISLYFLAVYKGILQGITILVPKEICSERICKIILKSESVSVFRIPNFVLGIFYYLFVFVSTFIELDRISILLFLLLSWFVVIFSGYLAYILIFRLRMLCVPCFISHLFNLVIALGFTVMAFGYYV